MNIQIRSAARGDVSAMFRISVRAHQGYGDLIPAARQCEFLNRYSMTPEREGRFAAKVLDQLSDGRWRMWVAEHDSKIVGYTMAEQDEGCVHLRGLFVDPVAQGQGVGPRLFDESMHIARPGSVVRLSVIYNNERARSLYESRGFKEVGDDPRPYYGARRVIMEWTAS